MTRQLVPSQPEAAHQSRTRPALPSAEPVSTKMISRGRTSCRASASSSVTTVPASSRIGTTTQTGACCIRGRLAQQLCFGQGVILGHEPVPTQ